MKKSIWNFILKEKRKYRPVRWKVGRLFGSTHVTSPKENRIETISQWMTLVVENRIPGRLTKNFVGAGLSAKISTKEDFGLTSTQRV